MSDEAGQGAATRDQAGKQILTVVLEDYYQVGAFAGVIPTAHWSRFESRIETNARAVLELLASAGARATVFVPGWIAERAPDAVRELRQGGHRIACQGYLQRRFDEQGPDNFRANLRRSRALVEAAAGVRVQGFRIGQGGLDGRLDAARDWPLRILAEEGFAYDSSVRPLGLANRFPESTRVVHERPTGHGPITEVPLSAHAYAGFCLPIAGGNFIRQLPVEFTRRAMDSWIACVRAPLVAYFHAWEIDPGQPRVAGAPRLQRLRHYRNLDVMRERVHDFLARYRFDSVEHYLGLVALLAEHGHQGTAASGANRPEPSEQQYRGRETGQAPVPAPAPAPEMTPGPLSALAVNVPAPSDPEAVTVVVPCYNEAANIAYLFNALGVLESEGTGHYAFRYVFVDDGSTDDTAALIEAAIAVQAGTRDRDAMRLVRHEVNRGIAAAVLTGLRAARTELVCCIDCDCTFAPNHLLVMLPMLKPDIDMVVASPFMPGGRTENVPAWRRALSRGASTLYRLVLNAKLASYTACFRVYRRSLVTDVRLHSEGFCGITELLAHVDQRGGTIIECPAVLESRLFGESKIRIARSVADHLALIGRLALRRLAS